jgi:hypothetical protein
VLIVGFQGGGGGGGGITSLTQDVLASGTGAVAATVVAARNGVFTFGTDAQFQGFYSDGSGGQYYLGASTSSGGFVTQFWDGASAAARSSTNYGWAISSDDQEAILNGPNAGSHAQLRIQNVIVIDTDATSAGIGTGVSQSVIFFQGLGTSTTAPNTFQASNGAGTVLTIANAQSGIGQWYLRLPATTTDLVGPQGFVYIGAEVGGTGGAVSTMGPNGVGTRNSQLGAGLAERFYTETTSVTPSTTVHYPLPIGTFTGRVEVVARSTAAGGGGGAAGDYFTETFDIQGSNVGGTVTLVTTVALPVSASTSQAGNTFGIAGTTIAGVGNLAFTATAVLAGGVGTTDWQWDLSLKVC